MEKHLWECDHPYYCASDNYFSNNCSTSFDSWADFLDSEGDSDLDMNLVFRWDWATDGNDEDGEEIRVNELRLFYVGQRKGLFRTVTVTVDPEDEPAIIDWLQKRYDHMLKLWEPFKPKE